MSDVERVPHFMNVVSDAGQKENVSQAAGYAGLILAGFYTDPEVASVAYAMEGVRLHNRAASWDAYATMARTAIEQGGAVFRLVANPPEAHITGDQIDTFSHQCAHLNPNWKTDF